MTKSIILVGANGSGKSTLGAKLSADLDLPYKHAGASPGDTAKAFDACLTQASLLESGIVLDRATPICRQVYEVPLSESEILFLKLFANHMSKRSIIIHCVGQGKFSRKEYYPEGHYEEIVRSQEQIRTRYFEVLKDVPHILYNWQTDRYCDLVEFLNEEL